MEHMDIVNDFDEIIGQTTQEEIYTKRHPHRIVHVFVVHPETGEVYFQKRAESKSYLPGYYCTSAGGHVRAGETYEQAAKRELVEEIGLNVPVKQVGSTRFIFDHHKRFIKIFISYAKDGFNFSDGEVSSGEFLNSKKAYKMVQSGDKIHPQLEFCYKWLYESKPELLQKHINRSNLIINPSNE